NCNFCQIVETREVVRGSTLVGAWGCSFACGGTAVIARGSMILCENTWTLVAGGSAFEVRSCFVSVAPWSRSRHSAKRDVRRLSRCEKRGSLRRPRKSLVGKRPTVRQ